MTDKLFHFGKLGPDRRKTEARFVPKSAETPESCVVFHVEEGYLFALNVDEIPMFIEFLNRLVPVVDRIGAIKTGDAQ